MSRFAVQCGYSCPGAFSKCLSNQKNKSIVSYADRRYSQGQVYEKNGFIKTNTNPPSYKYITESANLENRMKYQKHKLAKFFDDYDSNLTEWQNMMNHGYDRIWDCGTQR